jgi:VIT1/CCC1 family predicted Fe2+/Mn2+ transporter
VCAEIATQARLSSVVESDAEGAYLRHAGESEHELGGETGRRGVAGIIRELVFGAEDGLLSALGLVTGVAAGTSHSAVVLLAGAVGAISGAISMGAGNYLGVKSQAEVLQRRMREEERSIREDTEHEFRELTTYYQKHGMTPEEVRVVVPAIMRNKDFLMEEMAAHELRIDPDDLKNPFWKGFWMFVAYLVAAALPIWPYAVFARGTALMTSIGIAVVAVFGIGAARTILTGRAPIRSGLEMLAVATCAGVLGYIAGHFVALSDL